MNSYPLPQAKLLAAMSLYSMQARGPASEKLAEVLAAECLAYWQVRIQIIVPFAIETRNSLDPVLFLRLAGKCASSSP